MTHSQLTALAACTLATDLYNAGRRDELQVLLDWFDQLAEKPLFLSNSGGTSGYFTYTEEQLHRVDKDFVPVLPYVDRRRY